MIESWLAHHGRAALLFSSGKDSLAALLLMRPYWNQIDVVWSNPGAAYPEVVAYMASIAERVPNFIELKGEQPAWIAQHGWPADVVPTRSTGNGANHNGDPEVLFQPYFSCCQKNMWQPIQDYLKTSGHTLTINGQRRSESMRNRSRDEAYQVLDGIGYCQPLNEWSESSVFEFIRASGEPLPPFYEQGAKSSPDCWNCTAYLDHNQDRLHHMRANEPMRWAVIQPVLQGLQRAISQQTAPLDALLDHNKD